MLIQIVFITYKKKRGQQFLLYCHFTSLPLILAFIKSYEVQPQILPFNGSTAFFAARYWCKCLIRLFSCYLMVNFNNCSALNETFENVSGVG